MNISNQLIDSLYNETKYILIIVCVACCVAIFLQINVIYMKYVLSRNNSHNIDNVDLLAYFVFNMIIISIILIYVYCSHLL